MYFWTTFKNKFRFFFLFKVLENEIFNIMFFSFLSFSKSKVSYLLSQVKITLTCFIFMFFKEWTFVLHFNMFLCVFHYFGNHGRPASQIFNPLLLFDYFNPAIILIKNSIWACKGVVWDQSNRDWWFWALKFHVLFIFMKKIKFNQ